MAIKYIPYPVRALEGQAVLDNFVRTRRVLRYRDANQVYERIRRGMPLYEVELKEGDGKSDNIVMRGECLTACAYLKEHDIKVDLIYIDPPFASGADYAKKVYVRRNPKVAEAIHKAENELDIDELRAFEEKMYGDIWDKERYLNWMYENLCAIKAVMSDTASIYVHLDYHIGHYVKILMDEIFGEQNFVNEIIWYYPDSPGRPETKFVPKHDTIYWYRKSEVFVFNGDDVRIPLLEASKERYKTTRYLINSQGVKFEYTAKDAEKGKIPETVWQLSVVKGNSEQATGYSTQKPEALLERIIKASSKEGMFVADFFGGSGTTARVAARLNRRFIHADIGINSIQVTRDKLKELGLAFDVLEVKDGVQLYRNPVQTMDKLKSLIKGLRNEDQLDKFWEGSIMTTKDGMVPVYLPNLMDSSTRLLDKPLMNRIIREAMPDLPDDTKRIIVYYIDITSREEIEQFIREQNTETMIEIELRDLKQVLDEVVVNDEATYHTEQVKDDKKKVWQVTIDTFMSDRVMTRIREYNEKSAAQAQSKGHDYKPLTISDEGLECIEWLSLDCEQTEQNAPWHSNVELYIDKNGYTTINGKATDNLWDGTIRTLDERKPLRLKIRNICGDETIFLI
jgi:adenine-specific DNA-methyltransferase